MDAGGEKRKCPNTSPAWLLEVFRHVEGNLQEHLSVAGVGHVVGRSESSLQKAISRATGRSFGAYLLARRIERARGLLEKTDLPVREVAAAVGFRFPHRFSGMFRRATGLSPRRYRDRFRARREPGTTVADRTERVVFREDSSGGELRHSWLTARSRWERRRGVLRGRSVGHLSLGLRQRLPAEFRLSVELRRERTSDSPLRPFSILLCLRSAMERTGYGVYFGDERIGHHYLQREGAVVEEEPGELLCGTWHEVSVSVAAGQLSAELDGHEILHHRDLLPIPAAGRSALVIAGWETDLSIRRVEVVELVRATPPTPLERADEYAAEREWERALELYEKELAATHDPQREEDLLYKAGTGYMQLGLRIRGLGYLERFARQRSGTTWGSIAALEVLRARAGDLDDADLLGDLRRLLGDARTQSQRTLVLDHAARITADAARWHDDARAISIAREAFAASPPLSRPANESARVLVQLLYRTYRYDEVAAFAADPLFSQKIPRDARRAMELTIALAMTGLGRSDDARQLIDAVTDKAPPAFRARGDIHRAVICQSTGELREALELFVAAARAHADLLPEAHTAAACADLLLALAGRHEEARYTERLLAGDRRPSAVRNLLLLRWSLQVIAGRYEEALRSLSERLAGKTADEWEAIRETLLLCALHELSGDATYARRNLEVLDNTYSKGPSWRWGLPARYLLGKASVDRLWQACAGMPLLQDESSASLFYMLALVERKRGRKQEAVALLRHTVKADPLNYWAAVLARRELGQLTPEMKRFLVRE